jgi:UDP-3-O-[3-hydroxymyristoyl] N-acetylglucosamine deacetylase
MALVQSTTFPFRSQQTLRQTARVDGFGYWSGLDISVEFRPAEENAGVTFVRADLAGQPRIPANVAYRVDSIRRTTLAAKNASVEMVEHVLAALFGLQIDNCEIWVDRAEMPGKDGSSLPFVEALLSAGIVKQHAKRSALVISQPIELHSGHSSIAVAPIADGLNGSASTIAQRLELTYELNYTEAPAIGKQTFSTVVTPESFQRELAPARTFLLKHEAEWLKNQGLGKRVTYQDLLVFDGDRVLDNELRFADECVRHKALDVVGDLALVGCDLIGHVRSHRSGHALNAAMALRLLSDTQCSTYHRRAA